MPIYEYQCTECAGVFQRLVRGFSDPADLACPRCQSTAVTRRISQIARVIRADDVRSAADITNVDPSDADDPQRIREWGKRIGASLGDEAGADWDEVLEQTLAEEQEFPSQSRTTASDDLGWA